MACKKTIFNDSWINPAANLRWSSVFEKIQKDPFSCFCKICGRAFQLSNMGRQALVSHEKGMGHQKNMKNKTSSGTIQNFLNASGSSSKSANDLIAEVVKTIPEQVLTQKQFPKNSLVVLNDVHEAEIYLALHCIETASSVNSIDKTVPLLKKIFKDSNIASNLKLASNKLAYLISFGLAPYFSEKLEADLVKCEFLVVCFDESLNRITQRGQMDIVIRYWDGMKNSVETRYLRSVFMNRSRADDILNSFMEGIKPLPLKKILQVSMDGPNVNWKFLKLLKEETDVNMIDLGSCGLHVLHGALQTGHKAAQWSVNETLRGFYWLFKDSPARRSAFINLTGESRFPLKFCQTRWVEGATAAKRALEVFDNIVKYVECPDTKLPDVVTVRNVKKACKDGLMKCKLAFFATIAGVLEKFLTEFQSPTPMAPFLYRELQNVCESLLKRFIKKEFIQNKTPQQLMKIDFSNKAIYINIKNMDIGFSVRKYFNECKSSEKCKLVFLHDCQHFLISAVQKIFERCSLKYSMCEAISCFDPYIILANEDLATNRLHTLLQIFSDRSIISSDMAENCQDQFYKFLKTSKLSFALKEFDQKKQRLDDFYNKLLDTQTQFKDIFKLIKMVLIMSHGNASVESGFSINKNLLIENLLETTIIAKRQVYDAIKTAGGTINVVIDKKMLQSCKRAHNRYVTVCEEKKNDNLKENQRRDERKRVMAEMKQLESKKIKLTEITRYESQNIDKRLDELRRKV